MRRRILWVAVTSVVLAVTVLGIPLAFAVSHIVTSDERDELEQVALRAALTVSPQYRTGDPIELPATEPGVDIGVYDEHGHRIAGRGPSKLGAGTSAATSGSVVGTNERDHLVEAVPVTRGEQVIAVVRVASPESAVLWRALRWGVVLLVGCVVAALCAAAFAAWQSRRLVVPLQDLARAAGELGAGDFSARSVPSGVGEIDTAGASLNRTAERLAAMIERERSFSTYASHQLRTPLTRLQLELESGLERGGSGLRDAAASAMVSAEVLSRTIDDVLRLSRREHESGSFDVEELLNHCRDVWQGPLAADDRPLRVVIDQPLKVAASLPAARQIMHVLVDNAVRHAEGP